VLQPDPTGESPVTTACRSLATALSKARFASGTRTKTYTTTRGTTAGARIKWMFTTDKARAKMGRAYPVASKES
jgi:hypothetical protein